MALADVLRERVSRRGRTAQVDCGELGIVTVEALPPRECAALGMADGGRALLYAACRELQAAGETLRRERRLFTPDEVTAYVSDKEARTAARTVLALSGVTLDEDEADNGDETADQNGKADNEAVESEGPDKSGEAKGPDRTDEKKDENRLDLVHETVQQISEVRPEIVQEQADSPAEPGADGKDRLESVHENVQPVGRFRPTIVQFPEASPADGQVSREFFGEDKAGPPTPSMGADLDFVPQNLALSEKNGGFALPLKLSGDNGEAAEQMAKVHEITSDFPVAVHEITSEFAGDPHVEMHETMSEIREMPHESKSEISGNAGEALHENTSEIRETVHETESEVQSTPHEIKSEIDENRREGLHETTSELVEQVAERLLEGLRRAAAVR